MNDVTLGTILALIAAITAIWAFVERIIKAVNATIDEKLKPMQQDIELTLEIQLGMMTHLIDGNHVDKLKELREKASEELVSRKYSN